MFKLFKKFNTKKGGEENGFESTRFAYAKIHRKLRCKKNLSVKKTVFTFKLRSSSKIDKKGDLELKPFHVVANVFIKETPLKHTRIYVKTNNIFLYITQPNTYVKIS